MTNFLTNVTTTDNGALTLKSSTDKLVDLFFIAGASRNIPEKDITNLFDEAYASDNILAMKLLFWSRDIRGGIGERRFFNIILNHISIIDNDLYKKISVLIPEYGYWKDYIKDENLKNIDFKYIRKQLIDEKNTLLAKWLPRKGPVFNNLFKELSTTPKELRKILVELSKNGIEQKICSKNFDSINYSQVPSLCFKRNSKVFYKFDETRFSAFIEAAKNGEVKVNASAIFPYQLYQKYKQSNYSTNEFDAIKVQWENLPNYIKDSKESFLPVCDVSGSMNGLPMDISISLGVYLSERNNSAFKDTVLTFSTTPTIEHLKGDIIEKFNSLINAHWGGSTDIEKTYNLILDYAIAQNVKQEDLPTTLLIISDMEFNNCTRNNFIYDDINITFNEKGYIAPKLCFWNVNGRVGNIPTTTKSKDIALVSGASPSIIQSLLSGGDFTPQGIMLTTLNNERYNLISEILK